MMKFILLLVALVALTSAFSPSGRRVTSRTLSMKVCELDRVTLIEAWVMDPFSLA